MDTYNIDNIERIVKTDSERLCFPTANSDKDSIALILDFYPDVYGLMDHVLQHQFIMHQNNHWKDEDKNRYVERVIKIINYSPNGNLNIKNHGKALETFYNESKSKITMINRGTS